MALMKMLLSISLLLAAPSAAVAADAQCDAKPFTLNKPKAPGQRPAGNAIAEDQKPKPVAPKTSLEANGKGAKPKAIAACKEPKKS